MLRGEIQNELQSNISRGSQTSRSYQYIEQVFRVPLWYIETLDANDPAEHQLWNRYVASSPEAALEVLQTHGTDKAIVHVLVPGYLIDQDDPALTRCHALWRCHSKNDKDHEVLSFVTDRGEFVDPQDGAELNELEKIKLAWWQRV